ncbi:MAG: outer membrane protein assembly factor BamE [Acidobacteriota bacterium]|nr:outer membrane protein assembly factor BamE [Acidobacteriota bacterium]
MMLLVYLGASLGLWAQTTDTPADGSAQEIALLKRTVADQERRLAALERTVRSMQSTVLAASRAVRPSWRNAEGWTAVKLGMSRDQVVEILGEPKSTDIVIDRQTLIYKDASEAVGTVVIVDDRVVEVSSPRLQIFLPPAK